MVGHLGGGVREIFFGGALGIEISLLLLFYKLSMARMIDLFFVISINSNALG